MVSHPIQLFYASIHVSETIPIQLFFTCIYVSETIPIYTFPTSYYQWFRNHPYTAILYLYICFRNHPYTHSPHLIITGSEIIPIQYMHSLYLIITVSENIPIQIFHICIYVSETITIHILHRGYKSVNMFKKLSIYKCYIQMKACFRNHPHTIPCHTDTQTPLVEMLSHLKTITNSCAQGSGQLSL